MRGITLVLLGAVAGVGLIGCHGRVAVGLNVGPVPDCPYGYYDAPPYLCAPAGYYGPEWFRGGVFIGAGPWFHGARGFRGHVDNHFHPEHGYAGPMPQRGERAVEANRVNAARFHGNEIRDGRGHVMRR